MKYDASMVQFHGDIVAAIKSMLYGDSDKAKCLATDSSPTPLREYLKKEHGTKLHGGNRFDCSSSCFLVIFDRRINELGETRLQMSWSQVTKFIRDNVTDIFGEEDKPGNAENSPSIEILDLDVRTFNAMKRAGINTLADVERLADYSLNHTDGLTLSDAHRETIEAFKAYRDSQAQQKTDFPCEDCGYDEKGCCNYPETPDDYCVCGDKQIPKNDEKPSFSIDEEIPAPAQSEPPAFDYSVLDTDTAASLRNCETVIRTETAGYFTLLGAKFKEAQDLLANHSSGTFEQWYTAMGFKRQTVYNLIKRFEFSSSPTIGERAEVFEALPLTLSYEISKPDAPAELVDKVLDGDITSNAEYQRLKKQLEEAEEKREFWIKQNSETNKENQQLRTDRNIALTRANNAEQKLSKAEAKIKELECEADEADREYAAMADREDQHETLIADLKRQIKELESRPVEVAVEQDTAALAEKDKLISELKGEIERLSDNSVKSFVIKLTIEEYVQLQDIVKSSDNHCIVNAVNSARMIKL